MSRPARLKAFYFFSVLVPCRAIRFSTFASRLSSFAVVNRPAFDFGRTVRISGDKIEFSGERADILYAGKCWGYVLGVEDSIPQGEGFDPAPNVLGSQYVDVVFKHLQDHPEQRQYAGYALVRTALTEAFPTRQGR